jgi:hypothetical protein
MTNEVPPPESRPRGYTRKGWSKSSIIGHPVVLLLTAVVGGFTAGVATFERTLALAGREIVPEDSCVPKSELAGTMLRTEAIQRIVDLIEHGEKLNDDRGRTTWLLQVLTFVQYLTLEKNTTDEKGVQMSAAESNIRYALKEPQIAIQAQKTLGVLKGLRSALSVQRDPY